MSGALVLNWSEGGPDEQRDVAFTLNVYPVDLAGNVGPPEEVVVSDDMDDGLLSCAVSSGGSGASIWIMLGLGIVVARRRAS